MKAKSEVSKTLVASLALLAAAVISCITGLSGLGIGLVICLVVGVALFFATVEALFGNRVNRLFPWTSAPWGKLVLLLVGALFIVGPIAAATASDGTYVWDPHDHPLEWLFGTLYVTAQTLVMQTNLADWSGIIQGTFDSFGFASIFAIAYNALTTIYLFALPIAIAFTAVDVVVNRLSTLAIWAASRRREEIYVLNGVSPASAAFVFGLFDNLGSSVAGSRRRTRLSRRSSLSAPAGGDGTQGKNPLVIFTNMGEDALDTNDTLVKSIKDRSAGKASVVFTPLAINEIPGYLGDGTRPARNKGDERKVYYLLLSSSCDKNVSETIRLTDAILQRMEIGVLDRLGWRVDELRRLFGGETGGDQQAIEEAARQAKDALEAPSSQAKHIHIYCVHENPDDDIIFDSLPSRGPDDEVKAQAARRLVWTDENGREVERDAVEDEDIVDALVPLEKRLRTLMEVRLIDEVQECIYDLMTAYPLFSALDDIQLSPVDALGRTDVGPVSPRPAPHQLLTVLIVGLGHFGEQALRSAFWFGRLPGVELRIIAVDRDADVKLSQFASKYPEMMAESVPEGAPSACPSMCEPTSAGARVPTVRLCKMDVTSSSFDALLAGRPVETLSVNADGTMRSKVEGVLPGTAHVYAFTTLGDDGLDLRVSLHMHRALSMRKIGGDFKTPVALDPSDQADKHNPLITLRVCNDDVLESISHLVSDKGERFALFPFGSTENVFDYDRVIGERWEEAAQNMSASYYDTKFRTDPSDEGASEDEILHAYNKHEVKKLSNRAGVRYIPYRLWTLGRDVKPIGVSTDYLAENRTWLRLLGAEGLAGQIEQAGSRGSSVDEGYLRLLRGYDFKKAGLAGQSAAVAGYYESERRTREQWPLICALGNLEHARWCAFYRAQGWRRIDTFEELERIVLTSRNPGAPLGGPELDAAFAHNRANQSPSLKRHFYLVDPNVDQHGDCSLAKHGELYRDDPFAYDRTIVINSVRIYGRMLIQG